MKYHSIGREQIRDFVELAYAEVIIYNKKDLERDFRTRTGSEAYKRVK